MNTYKLTVMINTISLSEIDTVIKRYKSKVKIHYIRIDNFIDSELHKEIKDKPVDISTIELHIQSDSIGLIKEQVKSVPLKHSITFIKPKS